MKRRIGNLCMIAGAVLIAMALALFVYNKWEAKEAENAAASALEKLMEQLPEGAEDAEDGYWDSEQEMTVVNIDGYDYIGYLSIPSLNLELPVMAQWSYEGLHIAPGRFSGTTFAGNLVIAGHNYARHFSPIKWLETGTELTFTDMDHRIWHYQVSSIEILQPTQVEEMTGKSEGDSWDLTLFTCTTGGKTRCAVRYQRVE